MKKIFLLLAVLVALTLVFVACTENETPEETTPTVTEAPTDAETPTEDATEVPTEDATTEDVTTEEITTEEATTEEITTEEPTTEAPTEPEAPRYDDLTVPQDQWTVSGHCPEIVGSEGHANSAMVAAGGVASGALLHQGSIALGEIDLSKYSKAVIYFGVDGSDVTLGHHAANAANRIMLVSADMNMAMSPAAETVIASADYTPAGWAVTAIEIDLTGIDYNGPVFVTYDTLPGTFMLFSEVTFIGAEMPAPAEPYEVDLSTVGATGNYPVVDVPVPGSVFGKDHCFALHYGSIALGEMDLSKYSKVTVTYATPDDATVPGASDQYNKTGKRVMLLNAPSAAEGTFECLPEESAIVAYNQYEMSPASLTLTTVEIDLTEVTYNGQLYLTFDYRDANNAQAAEGFLVWLTGVVFS